MASKPSNSIDWTSTTAGSVTEPAGADKTAGFAVGSKPPAQWFNWFWKLVTDWVKYLKDGVIVGEAGLAGINATGGAGNANGVRGTGTGTSAGVVGNGSAAGSNGVVGTGTDGSIGGLFTGGSAGGNGVEGIAGAGGGLGVIGTGALTGAGVQGTGGATNGKGVVGVGTGTATGVQGTGGSSSGFGGVFVGGGPNGKGLTSQGAGTGEGVEAMGSAAGGIALLATSGAGSNSLTIAKVDGYVHVNGDNPAPTTAFTNRLTPNNFAKAWGKCNTGATPAVNDGFNVTSIAGNAAGSMIVTLASAMANTNYCVLLTPGAAFRFFSFAIISATQFRVDCYLHDGTSVNLETNNFTFSFAVFGDQ